MSLANQKGLLRNFIQSMYDEGIVNDQFYQLQAMKESIRSDYVVRAVTSYCTTAQTLFTQLSQNMNEANVDFELVNISAHELYSWTSSVGAEHVRCACVEILRASEDKDKEYCSWALYWTKNEYSQLRRKFETLVQEGVGIKDLYTLHSYGMLISAQFVETAYLNNWSKIIAACVFIEGVVNAQFSYVQSSKSAEKPDGVVQLINSYCVDVQTNLSELTSYIDSPDVDFSMLVVEVRKIEERSSRVGAERVRHACADLIRACDEKHKQNFSRALSWMKNEFAQTQNKLEALAQMEQKIIRLESKPQNQNSSSCVRGKF